MWRTPEQTSTAAATSALKPRAKKPKIGVGDLKASFISRPGARDLKAPLIQGKCHPCRERREIRKKSSGVERGKEVTVM
ncbi:Hypothetical predicted protein [Olea europaea subsp. europaea]|uniref:Uncharacterized protein n=1 Tax=Olea europaea subsp. europaea TaxID=158383 RepID=A0A8S0VNQ3_OLEEU|nr:Hypothetical predicted protein [Olea europaea subsp. europaea]